MARRPATTAAAWGVWSLWAVLTVAATVYAWHIPHQGDGDYVVLLGLVGYSTVGAIVSSRQPGNPVGWLLLAIAIAISLSVCLNLYAVSGPHPGYVAVAWVAGWMFYVWLALVVGFLPLIFPDGRLLSPRWRPVWWFVLVSTVVGIVAVAFKPGHLAVNAPIVNPLGVHGPVGSVLAVLEQLSTVALVLTILLAGTSLALRFRRARGGERQQLKWFAYAVLLTIAGFLLAALGQVLPTQIGDPVGSVGWTVFLATCILGIPVATGTAILRHRLFDIDLVINRTLVYGALTASLVVTYVGSVLVLRLLLNPFTGESQLSVAGSTLAVAAVFRPARTYIQAGVDRRFYRRRYDAARTLDDFAGRLAHELDLDAVGADLRAVASQTVQPAHVSLWLRP